ncbi:MAG TPA: L,D-transpeptidase [Terriglobales bacterium]|jgi:lipoprotein-anchoring transpeptidase ErfK/SrfK|nr:L,D-transpeptidase [Terriglobales bacterium]
MKCTSARTKPAERLLLGLVLILSSAAMAQSAARTGKESPSQRIHRQVLVSITDRKLAVLEDGKVIRTFSVSVGAALSPSPTGEFQIINRLANPTYYHPGTVIPPGDGNPVGPRWIGLSQKGFGIHGTNQPRSIGHAASHGCIRLNNRDVVRLFEMVGVGDTVSIRGERDPQSAQIFGGLADTDASAVAQAKSLPETSHGQ